MNILRVMVAALLVCFAIPALAQEKAASDMDAWRQKVKADKKLVVAENLDLSEAEAKAFWPVYEAFQADLDRINGRMVDLIARYAELYKTNALSEQAARNLIGDAMGIEQAEVNLKQLYFPKLFAALPGAKVARYLQIENKIRAVIKYELAGTIPLARSGR
jgi:hypothetical protein